MNASPKNKNSTGFVRKQSRKFMRSDSGSPELIFNESQDLKEIWINEIKILRAQTFINLEVACTALIQAVVQRFYPGGHKPEIEQVLKLYIQNDPELLEQINNILIRKL